MTSIDIIAGLGYSDEGKGHICKKLANEYDVIMRVNGSWSSSHQIDDKHYGFHLPSTLDTNVILIVGSGMYVNPVILAEELQNDYRQRQKIYICEDCPVILLLGSIDEKLQTLGSGVRQANIDRLNHVGVTLKDVAHEYGLEKYLINDDEYYNLTVNKKILVEGSHGYLIDRNFGQYPETTSTDTTPGGIMGLTKYSPEYLKKVIFVAGLFSPSLGTHSRHMTYEHFDLKKLIEVIPENIKTDIACGNMMQRNFGPLDCDTFLKIIRYYPNCEIIFNFYDIIVQMKTFYYILNKELITLEISDNFYDELHCLLETIFSRNITITIFDK